MDTINIQQLKKKIEKKIRHHYLETHIQRPEIDEEKLRLVAILMHHKPALSAVQKERYIMTTMLVQVALDTHELVSIHNNVNDTKEKMLSNQLSVLAGDYYSGLYYFLLAEMEEFSFIHSLATAIKEINEYKMQLYYMEADSLHDYIAIAQKIDSLLYVHSVNEIGSPELVSVIELWLLTNKLMKESKEFEKNQPSPLLDHWLTVHTKNNKRETIEAFYSILQHTKDQLKDALTHLPDEYEDLNTHIHSKLNDNLYSNNQVAEEG